MRRQHTVTPPACTLDASRALCERGVAGSASGGAIRDARTRCRRIASPFEATIPLLLDRATAPACDTRPDATPPAEPLANLLFPLPPPDRDSARARLVGWGRLGERVPAALLTCGLPTEGLVPASGRDLPLPRAAGLPPAGLPITADLLLATAADLLLGRPAGEEDLFLFGFAEGAVV